MSRSRFEGEIRPPVQSNGDTAPRPQMSLVQRLAHQYDSTPRRPAVLGDRDGIVIGGTGGNVRPATLAEVAHVLNGGVHAPIDANPLSVPGKKLSRRERIQVSMGLATPEPQTPFEGDYKRSKAEREARKAAARELKNKGNKGRKTA